MVWSGYGKSPGQKDVCCSTKKFKRLGSGGSEKLKDSRTSRSNNGARDLGYAAKRISKQCSMIGVDGIDRYTSTLWEVCIRNYKVDKCYHSSTEIRRRLTWRHPTTSMHCDKLWNRTLPSIEGRSKIVLVRLWTCSAEISSRARGDPSPRALDCGDCGIRFTMQWSKSDIVRSCWRDDWGNASKVRYSKDREDRVRFVVGTELVDRSKGKLSTFSSLEARGAASWGFLLNVNFDRGFDAAWRSSSAVCRPFNCCRRHVMRDRLLLITTYLFILSLIIAG